MTDHHDFDDHHFDDDLPAYEEPGFPAAEEALSSWEDHHDDVPDFADHTEPGSEPHAAEEAVAEPVVTAADLPDLAAEPVDVFPPAVDVGDLPEPVDGFPWIDSGSLGLADIAAAVERAGAAEAVQPAELAEYAAIDLPPGVDPWAALADSDDPATSALAKWWSQS